MQWTSSPSKKKLEATLELKDYKLSWLEKLLKWGLITQQQFDDELSRRLKK